MRRTIFATALLAALVPGGSAIAEPDGGGGYGMEPVSLRLSAAGYMLDLRMRMVDIEKAEPLLRRQVKAMLREPGGGRVFVVPFAAKVGSLAQTTRTPHEGRVLAALFGNPGRVVRPGDDLELVIGDDVVAVLEVEG